MAFGHDRFGQVPFGTGSMCDILWDNLPRYYRDGDTGGILNKFLVSSGYTMDGVKFYAERIWWLFDAFKCREDLLRQLAHNFGIETAVVWNTDFLRRFVDHIGWWLKRKGTLPAINEILVMFGFADIEALELFDIEQSSPADPTAHPDWFVLRYGDLASPNGPGQNDPIYGINRFFHGSWKYTYGAMGWFTEDEIPSRLHYPLSFLKFVSDEALSDDEVLAIQAAVAVCLPRHVGVVRLEVQTGS